MDLTQFYLAALAILGPVAVIFIVWAVGQAASIAKQKWGVDIDVSALQKALAERQIESIHQSNLHSAIKTGVSDILGDLGSEMSSAGSFVVTPTTRETVVNHLMASIPDAMAALSPAPNVIDHLIIRFAQEQIGARLGFK